MKINEIIVETIGEGKVYGWIDMEAKEHPMGPNRVSHEEILSWEIQQGILDWDNDWELTDKALGLGWIRIGSYDHEYVFVQLIPKKVSKKAMAYLFRIIITFRPKHIAIDFEYGEGTGVEFIDYRKAIRYLRAHV